MYAYIFGIEKAKTWIKDGVALFLGDCPDSYPDLFLSDEKRAWNERGIKMQYRWKARGVPMTFYFDTSYFNWNAQHMYQVTSRKLNVFPLNLWGI